MARRRQSETAVAAVERSVLQKRRDSYARRADGLRRKRLEGRPVEEWFELAILRRLDELDVSLDSANNQEGSK
jgi:hypothetical protein